MLSFSNAIVFVIDKVLVVFDDWVSVTVEAIINFEFFFKNVSIRDCAFVECVCVLFFDWLFSFDFDFNIIDELILLRKTFDF